jgi:DnaJ-class molecular chaperone
VFSCCLISRGHPPLVMAIGHRAVETRMTSQPSFEWPGADEACPRCKGKGDVYYLHHSGADVVGGKRITCPACDGSGVVRVPVIPRSGG